MALIHCKQIERFIFHGINLGSSENGIMGIVASSVTAAERHSTEASKSPSDCST
jgi:hypothetical protein